MLTTQIIFSFFKLQKSFMKLAIMFWYGPNLDNVDIFKKSIVTVCEDSVMITCLKSFYLVNERSIRAQSTTLFC